MPTDTERREIAARLRKCTPPTSYSQAQGGGWSHLCDMALAVGLKREDEPSAWELAQRLADYIDPPYPDATASYKGWRAEVYDPDGVLVSPSNVAADLVRAHADVKGPSEPEVRCVAVVKVDGERLEKLVHDAVVELTGIDRDALLEVLDEMEITVKCAGPDVPRDYVENWANEVREALGANDG